MTYSLVLMIFMMLGFLSAQDEATQILDTAQAEIPNTQLPTQIDTTLQQKMAEIDILEQPEESEFIQETEAFEESTFADTVGIEELEEVPPALDAGYKGFGWGMERDQYSFYVKADSVIDTGDESSISVYGTLGEDTVLYTYNFSDKGFWKVQIDYDIHSQQLTDHIEHFFRVERLLTKRYGIPSRTSQNDMGTDREYLFSDFPKLARAYFRSSWDVDSVRIELLLDTVTPQDNEDLPVFEDMRSLLRLYYYHPSFYEKFEPASPEIPEETLIEVY